MNTAPDTVDWALRTKYLSICHLYWCFQLKLGISTFSYHNFKRHKRFKNERFLITTRQNNVRIVSIVYVAFNKATNGQSVSSSLYYAIIFLLFVFYICVSACRFVKGNIYYAENAHIVLSSRN